MINCHVLSGANHNPMMVERINKYLNKSLKVLCSERNSVRISQEGMLLALYAWNSCPMPGTDISQSFCAVCREFAFPIDYSTDMHLELNSTPETVTSYSKTLAQQLAASTEVAKIKILIDESHAYYQEFIACRPK